MCEISNPRALSAARKRNSPKVPVSPDANKPTQTRFASEIGSFNEADCVQEISLQGCGHSDPVFS